MKTPLWTKGYRAQNEYTFGLYPEMNPDNLIAYALFQNVKPDALFPNSQADASARSLVYCELGSGQGVTLNFMASRDPDGHYFGIDFNPNHIRNSRAFAKMANLDNVKFIEKSFGDLDDLEIPDCDVIVLHGIWSWISSDLRDAIARFINKKMKPGGVVYLSYNCAVGRSADDPMRKLFLAIEASSTQSELNARMNEIFFVAKDIAKQGAAYFANRAATLGRLNGLAGQDANYMEQEYCGETWKNFFFDEVSRDMGNSKMNFVCSTKMSRNLIEYILPTGAQKYLGRLTSPEDIELLKDIFEDTLFRQDVFVKGVQKLNYDEKRDEIARCHFALARARKDCALEVRLSSGKAKIAAIPYNNILDLLAKGPASGSDIFLDLASVKTHIDLVAALKSLIAFGYICPVPDRASVKKAKSSLEAFESAYDHFVASKYNKFVGVQYGLSATKSMSMLDYYFWHAHRQGIEKKSDWIQKQLARTGRNVTFEGEVVSDPSRALQLLDEFGRKFDKNTKALMTLGYCI
jgi:hypothetical protein